ASARGLAPPSVSPERGSWGQAEVPNGSSCAPCSGGGQEVVELAGAFGEVREGLAGGPREDA
ncbi:MAG: hypothetical protein KC486_00735, partial [Myxococcales bacterium]|nr:hypothetical protein [Myxococcales bacterium]